MHGFGSPLRSSRSSMFSIVRIDSIIIMSMIIYDDRYCGDGIPEGALALASAEFRED